MEHGLDTGALAVVGVCFVLWGLVSAEHTRTHALRTRSMAGDRTRLRATSEGLR